MWGKYILAYLMYDVIILTNNGVEKNINEDFTILHLTSRTIEL